MTVPVRSGPLLVAAARAYLGAPFVHQGRLPSGMDCAGLLMLVLRDLGHDPKDVSGYGRRPWRDGLQQAVEAFYGPPAPAPLQVGDVVLEARRPNLPVSHIAIVADYFLGGLSLIHCRADAGARVCEHRLDDAEARLIKAIYR